MYPGLIEASTVVLMFFFLFLDSFSAAYVSFLTDKHSQRELGSKMNHGYHMQREARNRNYSVLESTRNKGLYRNILYFTVLCNLVYV